MVVLRIFIVALIVGTLSCSPVCARELATVQSGVVAGNRQGQIAVYRGIPFAAPPIGDLRWREPRPVDSWTGVRPAAQFAPACTQVGVSMPGETLSHVSEDCLYLNIWTPLKAKKLPVLVWIYGGGFTNGSASMPLYWGDQLAKKGIVVVTIAYRVGPLGFLAHPELTAGSPHSTSGNYGLLDQIAALQWVQKNIDAFGGDPTRVTIAGQSAGGMSVSLLMASPLSRGLFARAIAQSGGVFEPMQLAPRFMLAQAEKDGLAAAEAIGAHSLADLRAKPANEIMGGKMLSTAHFVIDPYVLPLSPYDAYVRNEYADVPILIGSNADEAKSLITNIDQVSASTFGEYIRKKWGPLPQALLDIYPHASDAEARSSMLAFERDLRFGWDMWAWARLHATRSKSEVYYYSFDHTPSFPDSSVYAGWGAGHFSELWYMFDHLDQEEWTWTQTDRALAETMASYWANFVRSGDPNDKRQPRWFPFKDGERVQRLGQRVRPDVVPSIQALQEFDRVYDGVRGRPFNQSP